MLTRTHQLNTQQLIDLDVLCVDCKQADGHNIAVYKHLLSQHRSLPSNILYYQKERLVGFLSTFFFYHDTCEVAIMVAPSCRRQGIAKHMVKYILSFILTQGVKTLLFSTPKDLNNDWLDLHGFYYQSSEYQMQRAQNAPNIIRNSNSLTIRPALPGDLQALYAIDYACFSPQGTDMAQRLQQVLHDPNYSVFIALKEGIPIGKAHLHWQPDSVRLTDLAILPHAQGCGFGSELLTHCINYCLRANQSKINLDVETANQHALKLYSRQGFVVHNAYDFWAIPINILQQYIQPTAI